MIIGLSPEEQAALDKRITELSTRETKALGAMVQNDKTAMGTAQVISNRGPEQSMCSALSSALQARGLEDATLRDINNTLLGLTEISTATKDAKNGALDAMADTVKKVTDPAAQSCAKMPSPSGL